MHAHIVEPAARVHGPRLIRRWPLWFPLVLGLWNRTLLAHGLPVGHPGIRVYLPLAFYRMAIEGYISNVEVSES